MSDELRGTLRLVGLYLRARVAGGALVGIAVVALIGWAWVRRYGDEALALGMALTLCPLAVACLVGVGGHSPFGETERTASRRLARYRLGHLGGLTLVGASTLALVGGADDWLVPDAGWVLARNLVGMTGLALAAALVLGGRLSWVAPVAFGLATMVVAPAGAAEFDPASPRWAWSGWPAADERAAWVGFGIGAVGLAVVVMRGTREAAETTA